MRLSGKVARVFALHKGDDAAADEVSNLRTTEIGPEFGGKAPLIVSEAGLYSLILKSRKPEANAFKRWITHEVIPAIRKTGGYHVPQSPEESIGFSTGRGANSWSAATRSALWIQTPGAELFTG